jgi:hypothetical protein
MILVPVLDAALHAIPLEDVLVGVLDHAGLECDDRIRNLERRGRQPALARSHLVAGDDQIIVHLVADEGAGRAEIEKPLGQIVTKLAALIGDVGKGARGQQRGRGKQAERMTTIDHEDIRTG